MKRNSGIIRNRTHQLADTKTKMLRKKFRFHKDDDESLSGSPPERSEALMTSTSMSSSMESSVFAEHYRSAKGKLAAVSDLQKKISAHAKARLSSFKDKQNEIYDTQISKMASQATNLLVQAEKCLKQLQAVAAESACDRKLIDNMSTSLAQQIRQTSRHLRQQQKKYFDTIRAYQKNIKNSAIQLSQEQKQKMKVVEQLEQMQEQTNDSQNKQIDELVHSINKLSSIYKQLNNLVIEQGSLIDRIDVNIQLTLEHTTKAVGHLEAADQAANSSFADKVMKIMAALIFIMAVILGLKWAA